MDGVGLEVEVAAMEGVAVALAAPEADGTGKWGALGRSYLENVRMQKKVLPAIHLARSSDMLREAFPFLCMAHKVSACLCKGWEEFTFHKGLNGAASHGKKSRCHFRPLCDQCNGSSWAEIFSTVLGLDSIGIQVAIRLWSDLR
jgi:hypothetical protein